MREITQRCLSVLMVAAVVGAGSVAFINLDQGPEPVNQYGAVQEGEAILPAVAAGGIALIAAAHTASKFIDDDVDEDAIRGEDDKETHAGIYQSAGQSAKSGEQTTNTFNNWMQDGSQIGIMEGQNKYIRYLNNNSDSLPTKSTAKSTATGATDDYFASREVALLLRFEKLVVDYKSLRETAISEANTSWADSMWSYYRPSGGGAYQISGTTNRTVTLANGSSYTYETWMDGDGDSFSIAYRDSPSEVSDDGVHIRKSPAPGMDSSIRYADQSDWLSAWAQIQLEHSEATTTVQNFVDQTYSKYQAGVINSSDLITPTLADRNYAPDGDNGVYTKRALTRMGYSLPTDFSETRTMSLVADGEEMTGVLLSDGLPEGGEWEIGTEYDVSNITGRQLVQTSRGMSVIEDNVTIQSIQRTDGSTKDSGTVEYTNPDYESADSLEAYKRMMQNISEQQAQINARQERLLNQSGGGGGLFEDLNPENWIPGLNVIQTAAAILIAFFLSILAIKVVSN